MTDEIEELQGRIDELEEQARKLQSLDDDLSLRVGVASQEQLAEMSEQKILLMQSQDASTTAGNLDTLKSALAEVLGARDARRRSNSNQRFSAVSSTVAGNFYYTNGILVEDGDLLYPLCGEYVDCGSFDMSEYPNEQSAAEPFLQHIEQSLKKNGVTFGHDGFKVMDVRNQDKMFQLRLASGQLLYGGLDGIVLPYGLSVESASWQLRCGIVVQHSDAHKAAYKEKYLGVPVAGTESSVQFTGSIKGQALMQVIAAAVYSQYPEVMLLHSSYDDNVILQFSEGHIIIWEGCSFNAAMAKMGSFLQTCSPERRFILEEQDWARSEAVKRVLQLRKKLKPTSSLIEQLDSVTAGMDRGAKFSTALEFFLAARYSEHVQAADALAGSSHDGPSMMRS